MIKFRKVVEYPAERRSIRSRSEAKTLAVAASA
jgi:hypothetical protein